MQTELLDKNKIAELLRRSNRLQVSRDTGVAYVTLHNIINGNTSKMRQKTALRLSEYFNECGEPTK